jgi:hypothetical protein
MRRPPMFQQVVVLILSLLLLSAVEVSAITLTVTDGTLSTSAQNDFSTVMQITGKDFSLSSGPPSGNVLPSAGSGSYQAGASTTLGSEVQLFPVASFVLRGEPHRLVGFENHLTFTTDPIVLPPAECATPLCSTVPRTSPSAPFTMTGQLLVSDGQRPQAFEVNLLGTGTATGSFISPFLPPTTAWFLEGLQYSFADKHDDDLGLPSHVIPEPTSLVLLGTGFAGLAAWRYRRTHVLRH